MYEKEKDKTISVANSTVVYVENFKESTKNLLEFISKLSKVAGYNINILKIYCTSLY